jgi:GT2 family glycosyltransferase
LLPTIIGDPSIGLIVGVLYHEDTHEVLCAGSTIDFKVDGLHLIGDPAEWLAAETGFRRRVAEYVPPILTLARRSLLDSVGPFDDSFKFCSEDIDLCLKLRLRGYRLVVDSTAAGYHIRPTSRPEHQREETQFHVQKNVFLLYFGYAPAHLLLAFLTYRSAWLAKQLVLSRLGIGKPISKVSVRANLWWLVHIPGLIHKRLSVRKGMLAGASSGAR